MHTTFRTSESRALAAPDDLRLLVESVVDYAIFVLDPEGNVASWNAGAQAIKGYSASEIVGRHFSRFYPVEDIAAGKPAWELEMAAEVGRVEDEGWRIRKDGSRFWANVVITALRDDRGRLRGFGKVTRDLTERRLRDEDFRRAEERFRLLVENISDHAVYMLDEEGRVTTWNGAAERMKGYAADEVMGQSFALFFPPEDIAAGKPSQELASARAAGRFEDEGWRVRKDGSRFWANAVLSAIHDPQGKVIAFAKITRDLTARRRAEEQERRLLVERAAREAAEEAERRLAESDARHRTLALENAQLYQRAQESAHAAELASRTKDEFLATVSHELRTPLNAILGWASLLKTRVMDPAVVRPIEVIHRNACAQVKIIDDILDVSRVITGKFKLDLQACDLEVITRNAMEVVRPSADARGIRLDLVAEPGGCTLVGDPERLQQVAWNLLSNAVKFTERGGTISVLVAREAGQTVLVVTDSGKGIDPSFLPLVFDRFRQADGSTSRRVGGLGLGLALVRHIVELHGGSVTATSEGPGKGATFSIEVPVRAVVPLPDDPVASSRGAVESADRPFDGALRGVRILFVDDEPDARDLAATVLTEAGATVATAASAAEGFAAFRRFRPDVLVSDIGMPVEDGLSFIDRIRKLSAEDGGKVPAVAFTAFAHAQDRVRAVGAGFTTIATKPVQPRDLVELLGALVRGDVPPHPEDGSYDLMPPGGTPLAALP